VLFNLGVACSEVGQLEKAIAVLQRLIELDPHHVHGLVALGVAFVRAEQYSRGEDLLRRALRLEPRNLWALRNLGGCLPKLGKSAEALAVLELAIEVGPNDMHTVIGLAQALEEVGRTAEADDLYLRIIRAGGPEQLVLLAKDRRTIITQQTMRNRAPLRMDVASYLRGALDKFQGLSTEEVRAIGIEIAMLGQSGLDINNPNPQYTLRSLPGHFSGIHLCAIMYAAFKHFAPHQDVGIDFSKECDGDAGVASRSTDRPPRPTPGPSTTRPRPHLLPPRPPGGTAVLASIAINVDASKVEARTRTAGLIRPEGLVCAYLGR